MVRLILDSTLGAYKALKYYTFHLKVERRIREDHMSLRDTFSTSFVQSTKRKVRPLKPVKLKGRSSEMMLMACSGMCQSYLEPANRCVCPCYQSTTDRMASSERESAAPGSQDENKSEIPIAKAAVPTNKASEEKAQSSTGSGPANGAAAPGTAPICWTAACGRFRFRIRGGGMGHVAHGIQRTHWRPRYRRWKPQTTHAETPT
ncbi:uncharacterized protein EV420DRAFT_252845 [Desarmillaria tabescens]|uniref:Uncharacterized protein n=1 Tax=Armillaria tabescens TaxID=1929756 RepID=A0AA39KHG0_ARMTA|nr:uncharacterized protein EV420DRAFT_252845 [Desarmillaria tabescens]KAK0460125.1 hypothetical protein EV420DRAFT_252845 [Desarmillaria tabescens]